MTPEIFQESLMFGLQLTAIGLTVVFSALIGITIIVSNFYRIENIIQRKPKADTAPVKKQEPLVETKPVETTSTEPADGELSPEVVAVIAAAVNEAISKKVRISRIRYRQQATSTAWQVQGRATIMGSHVVRNRQ